MNQLVLPLDLEIKLQENDIAYAVNDVVESIPDEAFTGFVRNTGCPAVSSSDDDENDFVRLYPVGFFWKKDWSLTQRQYSHDVVSSGVWAQLSHD